jgi:hypothetical protein
MTMAQKANVNRHLRCTRVVEDDFEDQVIWEIIEDEGAVVKNLNKLTGLEISECYWVDNSRTYLEARYSHWTSMELVALLDLNGSVVAKSISEVKEYIVKEDLFILGFYGFDASDSFPGEFLNDDDIKYAVVNGYGSIVIPLQNGVIRYLEEGRVFVCKQPNTENIVYDLKGRLVH